MSQELRDEARQREEERRDMARRREEFARDAALVASRPEGLRLLRWFLDEGDIFADDYQPGHLGAYRAGRRAAALALRRTLERTLPPRLFAAVALPRGFEQILFRPECGGNDEIGKPHEGETND